MWSDGMRMDAAWLCAAVRDEAREAEERREALAHRSHEQIAPKLALETADAHLSRELSLLRREHRTHQKRHLILNGTQDARRVLPALNSNNNRQVRSPPPPSFVKAARVYAAENVRLAAEVRDRETHLHRPCRCDQQESAWMAHMTATDHHCARTRRKKRRPHIVDDLLALEKRYALVRTNFIQRPCPYS